jgi:DNA (cytosine-5)-methyltransferase 1
MRHLDLFSGIAGFALAAKEVWGIDYECVGFCDNNRFCQEILKKRFLGVPIFGDIRTLIADTAGERCDTGFGDRDGGQVLPHEGRAHTEDKQERDRRNRGIGEDAESSADCECMGWTKRSGEGIQSIKQEPEGQNAGNACSERIDLLTGGFPCQPFSHAGKRRGRSDDRFLWPEMLRVIKEFKPRWVIAENVRGILSIEGGLVFEQVCSDLENQNYAVQAFIIPACAVNAPHRRDRIWIVAHYPCRRTRASVGEGTERRKSEGTAGNGNRNVADGYDKRLEGHGSDEERGGEFTFRKGNWEEDWREVALATCDVRVDDGLPVELHGFKLSKAGHRVERLKALGNAIVPSVAVEIMKAIKHEEH